MPSPARRAAAAFDVRLESVRAQVQLFTSPSHMVNTSSPPDWRRQTGDDLSDTSTGSTQRRHTQRTAYWTGAAVAQLPGRRCHFLHLDDLDAEQLQALVEAVLELKAARARLRGNPDVARPLAGRAAALLAPHPCLHTRVALETGFQLLGDSSVTHLGPEELAANAGEELADTARLLSHVVDCIVVRPGAHAELIDVAERAAVPVINGGTDCNAPCQVLGDLATVQDHKRQLAGLQVALISAGGPVTASWLRAARVLQLQLTCVCLPGHEPDVTTLNVARAAGASVTITADPAAVADADVIYVDDSSVGGSEQETSTFLHSWISQSGVDVLTEAPDAILLHSLPLRRGGAGAVNALLDSDRCMVADQAENRMLAAQTVLLHCCGLRGLWHPLRRNASSGSPSQRSPAELGRKVTFA